MLSIVIRDVDDVAGPDNARLYLESGLFQAYRGQWPEVLKIHPVSENVKPELGGGLVLVVKLGHPPNLKQSVANGRWFAHFGGGAWQLVSSETRPIEHSFEQFRLLWVGG